MLVRRKPGHQLECNTSTTNIQGLHQLERERELVKYQFCITMDGMNMNLNHLRQF